MTTWEKHVRAPVHCLLEMCCTEAKHQLWKPPSSMNSFLFIMFVVQSISHDPVKGKLEFAAASNYSKLDCL